MLMRVTLAQRWGTAPTWTHEIAQALAPPAPLMLIIISARLLYGAMQAGVPGNGGIPTGSALETLALSALAGLCLWWATRPVLPGWLVMGWNRLPDFLRWPIWRVIFTLHVLWLPWSNFTYQLPDALAGIYHNDAIAYIHVDADLVRQGINPYTDDGAFWVAASRYPLGSATPMLGGVTWGNDPLRYPTTPNQIAHLTQQVTDLATRATNDFDPRTIHNYPAGAFLLVLPLVWAGLPSVILLNFVMVLAMFGLLLWLVPRRDWLMVLVVLAASPVMFLTGMIDDFDALCIVFVIAAWFWRDHRRLSPILLGIGASVKQLAWFFIPFYLLEVARREGARAALQRGAWLGGAFLLPNLPFIVLSPHAWLQSMFIPMTDPMYPLGYGAIDLVLGRIVPAQPHLLWTVLEAGTLVALLVYQWRRPAITSDGLLLALAPLWFAWRSPLDYFAYAGLLALFLYYLPRSQRVAEQPQTVDDVPEALAAT